MCSILWAAGLALLACGAAHAQGGVPLVTVATDQSSLNLSDQFGIPSGTAINQAGDFAFVGNGDTALFLRPAGASSATRLLQIDDPAPGFPGSQILSISSALSLNSSRVLLFGLEFRGADKLVYTALLTYDGSNFHTMVSSDQPAPGGSGAPYGLDIVVGSIDDAGDIDFADEASGSVAGGISTTLYILPSGGTAAVRIVGTGDAPPAACTWCVAAAPSGSGSYAPVYVPMLNAQGEVLVSLWGGLFIGSKDGTLTLVPMATSGACSPQPIPSGTSLLPSPVPPAFLNNVGAVAFSNPPGSASAAICVAPPAASGAPPTPPTAVVSSGDTAPAGVGGGTILSPLALGFDDSGDIVYESPISGSSVTTYALLRHNSSSASSDPVAYNCEAAPGTGGIVFAASSTTCGAGIFVAIPPSIFSGVSIANGGAVSFSALLSNGESAVYRQSGAGSPEFISFELNGRIISYSPFLGFGQTKILNDGSVFFDSLLTTGAADFAVYLGIPGSLQTLMSTADQLPSGAVTLVGITPPRAAGHFVAFTAQPAAGRNNLLEADLTSGAITRVTSDNDPALATAGAPPGDRILTSSFFLNENGQVALETSSANIAIGVGVGSLGSPVNAAWQNFSTSPCGAIFLWSPSGGLAKVAAPGDTPPGATASFTCPVLNVGSPVPLNAQGQVAFTSSGTIDGFFPCLLCSLPSSTPGLDGVYLYSPAGALSEIVAANDTLTGQSQPTGFVPDLSVPLNAMGQVEFGAQLGASSQGQGFFLRQAGGTAQGIMAYSDSVPGSSDTFGFPHFISGLTDSGNLAFTAATSSAADGLFVAPAGGAIETLALDGGAAPGGGTFSLTEQLLGAPAVPPGVGNFAQMNGESDVAFGSTLTGGSANSGVFRAMHNSSGIGSLQAVAVQGQTAPGGGAFGTIPVPYNLGADFALGPDGSLAFVDLVTSGLSVKQGLFVARPDGTLVKVVTSGDFLPGGGVLGGITLSPKLAAGDAGKFVFGASIEGGIASRGVFVTAIAPGTATAATALSPLQNPAVAQQPVTFTATVTSTIAGTPTGTVTLFANGISLGTGTLSVSGQTTQTTVTTSSLAAGPDSIVAQYSGDSAYAPDDSAPMAIVAAGFAPTPSQLTVTAGQSLVIPLTIFAPVGSNMNFALSCSGLPANASCMFDSNPVAPAATGTAVKLTLTTMAGSKLPPLQPRNGAPASRNFELVTLFAAFSVLAALALARRRAPRLRFACCSCLATLALATALSGCGAITSSGPTSSGTPAGATSFTVTGTSGTTTISAVIKVTVQ